RQEVRDRVAARLRGEPVADIVAIEGLRRDGARCWLEATASVVEWDGKPATRVALADLTTRRRRETAEREALALRSVAEGASAAPHEVNNPLAVITGHLSLLARKLPDRPEATRHIQLCEAAVRRIVETIGHMSRITRLKRLELATGGIPTLDLRRSSDP